MPSSGAGGPCNHCGISHSCCWRRGPASKPVLCNACGSRYLVKRSLEGYQPLQSRREGGSKAAAAAKDSSGSEGSKPVGRRAPASAAGRAAKPKRAAQKRPDSDWSSDLEDSHLSGGSASLSDDTGGSGPAAAAGARRAAAQARLQRSPSPAKAPRLDTSYITSQAQLKDIGSSDFSAIAAAWFPAATGAAAFFPGVSSTLRLKSRKPVIVSMSAVW